jgi:uncharacterized protein YdaU (DUF1376 family)
MPREGFPLMGIHSPYFRWFPKDYNSDSRVLGMTEEQDLAYRRMLDASWELGPLPANQDHLAMLVRYAPDRFKKVWSYPLTECWQENGHGTLINQRLEDEREAMLKRSEKARNASEEREKKRLERVKRASTLDESKMILPASNKAEREIHPKPKPKKATTLQNKQPTKRKRSINPEDRIDFVRRATARESSFEGPGIERLKDNLRAEYQEELGDSWLWATWLDVLAHAFENEGWAEGKQSLRRTILGWFRRDAKRKREYQRNA